MTKHLPIGGSTAARTIACPAWLERAKKAPKPRSSTYADEGNLLHDAMEAWLTSDDVTLKGLIGRMEYNGQVLTEDHYTELLRPAATAVTQLLDDYSIDLLECEPFVQWIADEAGGSIDVIGLSDDGKTLLIADYKFGQVKVSVEHNAQLQFYALCAMTDDSTAHIAPESIERIVYAIIQPKVSHEAQVWVSNRQELDTFKKILEEALANPQRSSIGAHCKYCPVSAFCPDQQERAASAIVINPKNAETLATSLGLAREVAKWAAEVEKMAEQLINDGATIPGFKRVQGRCTRTWNDKAPDLLPELLGDKAYKTELITVTAAEKLLGKKQFAGLDLTAAKYSKPAIVPESDKRPAILATIPDNLQKLVVTRD